MARFDVYAHPDAALRKNTPFLLDVQNNFIDRLDTRVVIPLRSASLYRMPLRDLNPAFEVDGKAVVLDTAALAAFPVRELVKRVGSLDAQRLEIIAAMDCLFGAY
ncbi:MAG: CcdB family protein [Ramlibacter sp.]|nr:CcdB family protein [Ramlibacter sp.]MBX3657778.1 CcdB family protein [Ramlibacter sp.]MCW5648920.1 CcdB family protein [Ramlibacter sp.]